MDGDTINFEAWIKYLFNRPVTDPAWYWDDDPSIELPAMKFIEFGTRAVFKRWRITHSLFGWAGKSRAVPGGIKQRL